MFTGWICSADRPPHLHDGRTRDSRTGRIHLRMSLINDALKRADEQFRQSDAIAPPPLPKPLQPATHKSRAWVPVVLLMIGLMLVLALAAWFLSKWWEAQKQKTI